MLRGIHKPSDFDANLVDPTSDLSWCTMTDLLKLVTGYESVILPDLMSWKEIECWDLLVGVVDHCCTPMGASVLSREEYNEKSLGVYETLLEYAMRVKKVFGSSRVHTPNLHKIVCAGRRQERKRGPLSKDMELWIERMVQWMKQVIRGRAGKYPVITIGKDTLSIM